MNAGQQVTIAVFVALALTCTLAFLFLREGGKDVPETPTFQVARRILAEEDEEEEEEEEEEEMLCPIPHVMKKRPAELYFLHVPKAGGSAFVLVLLHFMGPRVKFAYKDCYNLNSNGQICNATQGDKGCRRVINCVDHLSRIELLGKEGVPSITMVRNPVSRLVSGWNFFWPHRPRHDEDVTFVQFVRKSNYKNIATKMLAGRHSYPYDPSPVWPDDFELAKKNLFRFTLVGIQEAFVTSVKLFFALLGQPPLPADSRYFIPEELEREVKLGHGVRVNKKDDYAKFKKSLYQNRSLVSEMQMLNHYDMVLYHLAVQEFCAKVRSFPCLLSDPIVKKELNRPTLCPHLFV